MSTPTRKTTRQLNATVKSYIVQRAQIAHKNGERTGIKSFRSRLLNPYEASFQVTIDATEAGYEFIAECVRYCLAHANELGITRVDKNGQ